MAWGWRLSSVTFRCCLKTIPHIIILSSRHESDIPSLYLDAKFHHPSPKIKKIPKNTNGRLAIPALAGLLVRIWGDLEIAHGHFQDPETAQPSRDGWAVSGFWEISRWAKGVFRILKRPSPFQILRLPRTFLRLHTRYQVHTRCGRTWSGRSEQMRPVTAQRTVSP